MFGIATIVLCNYVDIHNFLDIQHVNYITESTLAQH